MDIDDPGWTLIDDFFRAEAADRSTAVVRRYARVRRRLVGYLDTGDLAPWLGRRDGERLEAQRRLHDSGAFWALFGTAELVRCLPGFVHDVWLPPGLAEARAQVSLAARLLTAVGGESPDVEQTRDHLARARRSLAGGIQGPSEQARMPVRFRQVPGPVW